MIHDNDWTVEDIKLFHSEYNEDDNMTDNDRHLMGISYSDLKKMTETDLRKQFPKVTVDEMILILKENNVELKKEGANTVSAVLDDVALGGF